MTTLAERSLRVALSGIVPDDDPHVIADMQAEIGRLRVALKELADKCDAAKSVPAAVHSARLTLKE